MLMRDNDIFIASKTNMIPLNPTAGIGEVKEAGMEIRYAIIIRFHVYLIKHKEYAFAAKWNKLA